MKLVPTPQNLKEWIGMQAGLLPTPVVYSHFGFIISKVVLEAVDKGVFEAIGRSHKTMDDIADACNLDMKALQSIMPILTALGLLKVQGSLFTLTATSKKWILKDSPYSMYWLMMFDNRVCLKWMDHVPEFMQTGKGLQYHDSFSEEEWMYYEKAMAATSSATSREAARKIPVPSGAVKLLDIGGGPGSFSKALCDKHPQLQATVLDLPEAIKTTVEQEGSNNSQVTFRAGNILTDDIGEGQYDVIIMSNLAHHLTDEQNLLVTQKAYTALKRGGTFTILEVLRSDEIRNNGDLLSVIGHFFFALSSTSGLWSLNEIKGWLTSGGFTEIRKKSFLSLPGFVAVSGKK